MAGVDPPGSPGSTTWPENWRVQMAGGDEKVAKQLERYATPDQVGAAFLGLRQRVSSGELKIAAQRPGDGTTPEQLKAWKTEQGLPTEAGEYKFPLPDQVRLEDLPQDAKDRIGKFTGFFYDADLTQSQVDRLVAGYNDVAEKEAQAQAVADAKLLDDCEDNLRAAWGGEYRPNMKATFTFLESKFGQDMDALMSARTADGRRLINIPAVAKVFHSLARAEGIDGLETGDTGAAGGKSVDARIEEINQILQTEPDKYYRENLGDEKLKLLQRKEARGGRG